MDFHKQRLIKPFTSAIKKSDFELTGESEVFDFFIGRCFSWRFQYTNTVIEMFFHFTNIRYTNI